MKRQQQIENIFPKHLFWDMDYSKLSIRHDKDIIIPRALYATTKESFNVDIQKLEKLYTKREIVNCLKETKENISNITCKLVALKYNVPIFYRFKI